MKSIATGAKKLDKIDRRIVSLLQKDGRMPIVTLAKELGTSETTARTRLKRLIEDIPLRRRLAEFAAVRDWDQFHSPKNLSMALAAEAAAGSTILRVASGTGSMTARFGRLPRLGTVSVRNVRSAPPNSGLKTHIHRSETATPLMTEGV